MSKNDTLRHPELLFTGLDTGEEGLVENPVAIEQYSKETGVSVTIPFAALDGLRISPVRKGSVEGSIERWRLAVESSSMMIDVTYATREEAVADRDAIMSCLYP